MCTKYWRIKKLISLQNQFIRWLKLWNWKATMCITWRFMSSLKSLIRLLCVYYFLDNNLINKIDKVLIKICFMMDGVILIHLNFYKVVHLSDLLVHACTLKNHCVQLFIIFFFHSSSICCASYLYTLGYSILAKARKIDDISSCKWRIVV